MSSPFAVPIHEERDELGTPLPRLPPTSYVWIFWGIMACCFNAVGYFLLGWVNDNGHEGAPMSSLFLFCLSYALVTFVSFVYCIRKYSIDYIVNLFANKPKQVSAAFMSGVVDAAGLFVLAIGFVIDPAAKGPIASVTALSSAFVGIVSWRLFREKLNVLQILGIVVASAGVMLMPWGSDETGGSPTSASQSLFAVDPSLASALGVIFGLAAAILFATCNILIKYTDHHKMTSNECSMLLCGAMGSVGVCGTLVQFFVYRDPFRGLSHSYLLLGLGFLSGVFLQAGIVSFAYSCTQGKAGPATVLAESNAVLLVPLVYFIQGFVPAPLKLAGMGVALIGVMLLVLGEDISKWWVERKAKERRRKRRESQDIATFRLNFQQALLYRSPSLSPYTSTNVSAASTPEEAAPTVKMAWGYAAPESVKKDKVKASDKVSAFSPESP